MPADLIVTLAGGLSAGASMATYTEVPGARTRGALRALGGQMDG